MFAAEFDFSLRNSFYLTRDSSLGIDKFSTKNVVAFSLGNKYFLNSDIKLETLIEERVSSFNQKENSSKDEKYLDNYINNDAFLYRHYDLSKTQLDKDNILIELEIQNLNLNFSNKYFNFIIGRQPVSFNYTHFWNPLNWLTPNKSNIGSSKNIFICNNGACMITSTGSFDNNFYGVDAALISFNKNQSDRFEAIYASGRENRDAEILRKYTAFEKFDFDLLLGKVGDDKRIGAGLNRKIQNLSLKSEISYIFPKDGKKIFQITGGCNYKKANSFEINGEIYYNGFGVSNSDEYLTKSQDEKFISGEINNLSKYYFGISSWNKINSLLDSDISIIINIIDKSNLVIPKLKYIASEKMEFALGASIASGKSEGNIPLISEFGAHEDIYFLQYKFIF